MPVGMTSYGPDSKTTETGLGPVPGGVNYGGVFDLARRLLAPQPAMPNTPYATSARRPMGMGGPRPMASPLGARQVARGPSARPTEGLSQSENYLPLFTELVPGNYANPGGFLPPTLNRGGMNTVASGWAPASMAASYARPNSANIDDRPDWRLWRQSGG